jgi:hypothetical protein
MVAVSGNRYFVTEDDSPFISIFDTAGTKLGVLRPPLMPDRKVVRESDVRIARRRFVRFETPQVKLGQVFDRMPLPDTFPYYGWAGEHRLKLMKAMASGEIWVLNFGGVRDTRPVWSVYTPRGTFKGQVVAPEEIEILDASSDTAVALHWDELDVESVELRPLFW